MKKAVPVKDSLFDWCFKGEAVYQPKDVLIATISENF